MRVDGAIVEIGEFLSSLIIVTTALLWVLALFFVSYARRPIGHREAHHYIIREQDSMDLPKVWFS